MVVPCALGENLGYLSQVPEGRGVWRRVTEDEDVTKAVVGLEPDAATVGGGSPAVATTQDAEKRVWAAPLLALAAGVGLCVTLGVVISRAGRPMPVMAAVEVRLVVPVKQQAPAAFEPVILQEESWVSSDWEKDDHLAPIRGNVIEGVRVAEAKPAAPKAEPKRDDAVAIRTVALTDKSNAYASDPNIRWFNARPVRPAKTMWMTVTGYTPDEQSCGDSADGLTATMHSVNTNAMRMVAADTSVLPYGSMVSVPGYDDASIVPVLDCGGAIKGAKLDLMFATNKEAMQWGKQRVLVTVWEYADGKPAEDPRKLR